MAGVEEQEIMRRTGHRSEKTERKYNQSYDDILKKVSAILEAIPGVANWMEKESATLELIPTCRVAQQIHCTLLVLT